MIRRCLLLLLVTASTGAFATGCGSSSSSTTSPSAPASSTPPAGATTTAGGATSTSSSSASSNPAVAQAVSACKTSINAQPTLTASVKSKLTAACDKAANGDVAGARKVAGQVCQEIVKSTVPASAQAQALASCPKT
jgi:hypothetical protein